MIKYDSWYTSSIILIITDFFKSNKNYLMYLCAISKNSVQQFGEEDF